MDQNLIRDLGAMADGDNKAVADVAYAAKVEIVRLTAMLNAKPIDRNFQRIDKDKLAKMMAEGVALANSEPSENWEKYAEICEHSLNVARAAVCVRAAETARIMGRSWGYQWPELGDAIAEAILKGE